MKIPKKICNATIINIPASTSIKNEENINSAIGRIILVI